MLYLNMADTFNNQLLVLLVVNDPDSHVSTLMSIRWQSNPPWHSIAQPSAEEAALRAGLAPGQVHAGMCSSNSLCRCLRILCGR
jgi:hypothetical protein